MDGIPEKLALMVDDTTFNSRQALSSSFSVPAYAVRNGIIGRSQSFQSLFD
jgi:hypothetical protein